MMKMKALLAAAMTLAGTAAAHAQISIKPPTGTVPEIDALAGVAALAVIGAAVALIRERSK